MLPGWYEGPARWPSANTTRRTRRSSGIRRMWPSHWCLRVRTSVNRSYEGVVASSRYDLPVMRCSFRELNPLSIASALGVSVIIVSSCRRYPSQHRYDFCAQIDNLCCSCLEVIAQFFAVTIICDVCRISVFRMWLRLLSHFNINYWKYRL